jgi:hypothetical protein
MLICPYAKRLYVLSSSAHAPCVFSYPCQVVVVAPLAQHRLASCKASGCVCRGSQPWLPPVCSFGMMLLSRWHTTQACISVCTQAGPMQIIEQGTTLFARARFDACKGMLTLETANILLSQETLTFGFEVINPAVRQVNLTYAHKRTCESTCVRMYVCMCLCIHIQSLCMLVLWKLCGRACSNQISVNACLCKHLYLLTYACMHTCAVIT